LTDPFRIALLVALVYVWNRNRGAEGGVLPLAAGYAFVAVLLPASKGMTSGLVPGVLMGLVSNFVILGIVLGLWTLWNRRPR
jgi:hypothetical protein